jgi:hypothetical protein
MNMNLLTAIASGESHAAVRPNGAMGPGAYTRYCYRPGEIVVNISAQTQPAWSSACVKLSLQSGREYRTRATLINGVFVYRVLDVTAEPPRDVHIFNLPAGTHSSCPIDVNYSDPLQ